MLCRELTLYNSLPILANLDYQSKAVMELPLYQIYGKKIEGADDSDISGCSSFNSQQLLKHAYSPRISVLSSDSADDMVKQFGDVADVQHLFTYYENVFAYGDSYNKSIVSLMNNNNKTSTSVAGSGCVRFVGDVLNVNCEAGSSSQELFDITQCENKLSNHVNKVDNAIKKTSGESLSYESYRKHLRGISGLQNSVYLAMLATYNSSNSLSSFECFNHPVVQVVAVTGNDTKETIKELTSSLETRELPRWLDSSSMLQHIMILVDDGDNVMLQNALKFQEDLKIKYGKRSTVVPINIEAAKIPLEGKTVKLIPSLFQAGMPVLEKSEVGSLILSEGAFNTWKRPLQEFLTKDLVVFMNNQIKKWNEEFVANKTSLTGRLFGGRKWGTSARSSFFSFGSNQSSLNEKNIPTGTGNEPSYNASEGYYMATSPEMILRKLGDWYFMLGDYKNAFSTYELIKKDMLNDKAFLHLASLQEYTVFSLLLGAASRTDTDSQPITSKMINSTITPLIDSSFYSYLSRSNLKSYTLGLMVTSAELYLLLAQSTIRNGTTFSLNTNSLIELYLGESLNLFKKVVDSKLLGSLSNAYFMQRIAYVYKAYDRNYRMALDVEPPYYEEDNDFKKKVINSNLDNMGSNRDRKMELWLALAANELGPVEQPTQTQLMVWRLLDQINADTTNTSQLRWLNRRGGILAQLIDGLKLSLNKEAVI